MVSNMKIIERAVMPNGTKIQLEDWSDKTQKNILIYTVWRYALIQ